MICSPSNDRSTRFARAAGSKVVLISVSETTGAKDYSPAVPYGSRLAVRRASPRDMTSASGCRLSLCSRDRRTAAMPSSRKARAILSRVVGVSSAIGRGSHLDRGSGLLGVFNPAGRPASSHAFGTTARGLPGGGLVLGWLLLPERWPSSGTESLQTHRWRGESAANSSLKMPNSLREFTGNFIDSGLGGASEAAKKGMKSVS